MEIFFHKDELFCVFIPLLTQGVRHIHDFPVRFRSRTTRVGEFAAEPTDTVRYHLLTAFSGAERAGGKIIRSLTNHFTHPLAKLTLRLADPSLGRITGPVQEDLVRAAAVGARRSAVWRVDGWRRKSPESKLLHAIEPAPSKGRFCERFSVHYRSAISK